jgi:large subunit ribosomal protein L25
MAQQVNEIKASARPRSGTGGARAVRREGRVPGVVYGDAKEVETIALDGRELSILIGRGKFLSTVIDLDVDGARSRSTP